MRFTKYQKILHYFNLILVITTGILGIISVGIFPPATKLLLLSKLIPFPISLASRTATLLLSIAMLTLALNLARHRRRAYLSLLMITSLTIFTHLVKGFDLFEASVSLLTLISLLLTRDLYHQPSRPLTFKLQLQRSSLFFVAILIYLITTTLWLRSHQPHRLPIHYIRLSIDLSLIFLETYFFAAFFAPMAIKFHNTYQDRHRAQYLLNHTSEPDYLNSLKLAPDKTTFLSSDRQAFLSYALVKQYAFVLGNPVGSPQNFPALLKEFHAWLNHYSLKPFFYQINDRFVPSLQKHGYKIFPVGQEALIDLSNFSVENLKTSKLRQTYRKFVRRHYQTKVFTPPHSSSIYRQLKQVSDAWLQLPNHRERRFSVGYFAPQYLDHTPVFAVFSPDHQLLAWTNLHLFPHQQFATADLIRYQASLPNGTMEFLFTALFLYLKDQGCQTFSLGLAPLPPKLSPKEKLIAVALKHLSFIFRSVGVTNFKAKFATHWQIRYLAYRHSHDLLLYPKLFLDLTTHS